MQNDNSLLINIFEYSLTDIALQMFFTTF